MNAPHFSQHRAEHHTGPDDPLHQEPLDLFRVYRHDLHKHEGEPVMLPPLLLATVSAKSEFTPDDCTDIEAELDVHYSLKGTGFGIAFDIRDKTARLVKL